MRITNITQYLYNSQKLYSDRIALVDDNAEVSYKEYEEQSARIAYNLIKMGLFKKPIAVLMKKSAKSVMAFVGIARSGNYYTVIDPKMPESRTKKILETFVPNLILCDSENITKAKEYSSNAKVVSYEDLTTTRDLDNINTLIAETEARIIDTDILYVLFTSGSTGVPKGVIITHRSVVDYTEWVVDTFSFDVNSVFGNQAPFYFDNSVLDIYSSLKCGGTLHIIPQMCFAFPVRLLEYIRDKNVNTIFWVPTVLCRIADLGLLDKCDVNCLQKVIFAGEVMPTKQLNVWRKRLPNAIFANLYGPTEITVDCTFYICNRELSDNEPVPIGYPCRNTDILVLNDKNELVTTGEKGELCVRGSSLSLGYYNNPVKTSEAFIQNPLNNIYEEKIYPTGDIVHYNELGELIYDGRNDTQIKHSGHRIELGEIETAVSSINGINMNACLHDSSVDKLILFYSGCCEEKVLRKELVRVLPEYMIPNAYNHLEELPVNSNGKIDRLSLKKEICKGV